MCVSLCISLRSRCWASALLLTAAGCGTTYPLEGWQIVPQSEQAGSGALAGQPAPVGGAQAAAGRIALPRAGRGDPVAGRPAPAEVDRDRDGFIEGVDCNDAHSKIFPGAPDSCCDEIDSDCDGADSPRGIICTCMVNNDVDGDGYAADAMGMYWDCNDNDARIHPFAIELCFDALDNDCNGRVDKEEKICAVMNADADGDGFYADDCDDANIRVHPGALEICSDGLDNDCDGRLDNCVLPVDNDLDGFSIEFDCNDWDKRTYPGSADETCCDSLDSDCDGLDDPLGVMCNCFDSDGDGFVVGPVSSEFADCNDQDATIFPGAPEVCTDRFDNDCDRRVDADDSQCRLPM
jgi:hypothetical protein